MPAALAWADTQAAMPHQKEKDVRTVTRDIAPEAMEILRRATVEGQVVKLPPGQLDRPLYEKVNAALTALGGKWNRGKGGHVFEGDPAAKLAQALDAGEVIDRKKTLQFFRTPPALAWNMAERAGVRRGTKVLEPSAGDARLVMPALQLGAAVTCVEVDGENFAKLEALAQRMEGQMSAWHMPFEDFAAQERRPRFDVVLMNPPFTGGQDMQHIELAWRLLLRGGRLVAICSTGPFFREDRKAVAFRDWLGEIGATSEELPPETFKAEGTTVNTRLILATKEG